MNPIRHYMNLVESAMNGGQSETITEDPIDENVEAWIEAIMETSGDNPTNWHWVETTSERYLADFSVPAGDRNIKYVAVFWADGDGSWEFRWGNKVNDKGGFNVNATGFGNSVPVFRTVAAIVRAFISKAKPTRLYFSTPHRENNRAPLYRQMSKKLAAEYNANVKTYGEDDSTDFMIDFRNKDNC